MISIAAALLLAPIVLERDRSVPDNVWLSPDGASSASYSSWFGCVEQSAVAARHGTDSAATIADAVLAACRDEEAAAITDPANQLSPAEWTTERARLKDFALVLIIQLRANDGVSRKNKTN